MSERADYVTVLEAALQLKPQDRLRLAHQLTRDYDGRTLEAIAEAWAEDVLGMVKAEKGVAGIDGTLPNGRTIQVKSKKAGAHKDGATYVTLSPSTLEEARDLLVVFVDHYTCTVTRTIGPMPISSLTARSGRYYVSDMPGPDSAA